jgi:NAD(P)H-hydrate epimerase
MKIVLPKRKKDTHKGDYGKVFILAGSEGMLGAAILCSRGALRVGAGLVYLGVPNKLRDVANLATPEVIVTGGDRAQDLKDFTKVEALAIGPGLGKRRSLAKDLLFALHKQKFSGPIVVDADGLNAFAGDLVSLQKLELNLILTPHPGELARLLKKRVEDIQKDREKTTVKTAKLLKSIVILKGYRTVIAHPSGKIQVNQTGNPGMASAGVGDVLCGMIAGLAAQGFSSWEAARIGVYLHGLAGDIATRKLGEYSLIASDIIDNIPEAIKRC